VLGVYYLGTTARARGARLRTIFESIIGSVQEADIITLRGDCDFGDDDATYGGLYITTFPACNYVGIGCTLRHNIQIDAIAAVSKPLGTTGFVLSAGTTTFTGLTLKCELMKIGAQEDQGIICWNADVTGTVTFTNCTLDAGYNGDWLFYNWTAGTKSVTLDNCRVYYCRYAIAMVQSGGSQTVVIRNGCQFYGDGNNGNSMGESSAAGSDASLSAVLSRGGSVTVSDSTFDAIGLTAEYDETDPTHGVPRIATIVTDRYYTTSGTVNVTITNCTTSATANLCPVVNDVDLRGGSSGYVGTYTDGGGNTGIGTANALKLYS
jgi:hypothetical protein